MTTGETGPKDLDPSDLDGSTSSGPIPLGPLSPMPGRADGRAAVTSGARLGILSSAVEQLGSIATTVVLARLLDPTDFGVVGAATILVSFLHLFGDVGFGASLIKRRSIEEPVASTTFWASTGMGLLLTALLVGAAPFFAELLSQPDATPYIRALAPLLTISLVSAVSEARLLRELSFRWVYGADVANIAVYATLTLALAASGAGAWSMVIGRVVGEGVAAIIRLVGAKWWPTLTFHWASIRADLPFNGGFIALQVTGYFTKNVDYLVVSRSLGAAALGTYYVAFVLPTILRQRMTWLSTEVMLPVLSRVRDDRDALVELYRDSQQVLSFIALPVLAGTALTAGEIIGIAFGPQWSAAVGPMRWLAVAAMFEVGAASISTVFLATDRPGTSARLMGLRLVLMAACLAVVVVEDGTITQIAAAVTVAMVASTGVAHVAIGRALHVRPLEMARWVWPTLLGVTTMSLAVVAATPVLESSPLWVRAGAKASLGAGVYAATSYAVAREMTATSLTRLRRLVRPGS